MNGLFQPVSIHQQLDWSVLQLLVARQHSLEQIFQHVVDHHSEHIVVAPHWTVFIEVAVHYQYQQPIELLQLAIGDGALLQVDELTLDALVELDVGLELGT